MKKIKTRQMIKTVFRVKKVKAGYVSQVKSPVYKRKNNVVRLDGDDVFKSTSKRRAKNFFNKLK